MNKLICAALVYLCVATAYAQYSMDFRCNGFDDCLCKVPTMIAAANGKTASAKLVDSNGIARTIDLSKPNPQIRNYCDQLKRGIKTASPFAPAAQPVNNNKLAQVLALTKKNGK